MILDRWIHNNLTEVEVITVSQTGDTNENIPLCWLNHFIKHIGAWPVAHWRILGLDGQFTHYKDDFVFKCHENYIVPF